MKRRLLNLVAALSLLLCVAVASLWTAALGGYQWRARFAPAGGSMLAVRNDPLAHGRNRFMVAWAAPWGHPGLLDAGLAPIGASLPGIIVQINADPSLTRAAAQWQHVGIDFMYREGIVAMHVPDGAGNAKLVVSRVPTPNWTLHVPYWMPLTLLAIPALPLGVRRWKAHRHVRPGLCPSCGYDLRATPDRCPECGRAAS